MSVSAPSPSMSPPSGNLATDEPQSFPQFARLPPEIQGLAWLTFFCRPNTILFSCFAPSSFRTWDPRLAALSCRAAYHAFLQTHTEYLFHPTDRSGQRWCPESTVILLGGGRSWLWLDLAIWSRVRYAAFFRTVDRDPEDWFRFMAELEGVADSVPNLRLVILSGQPPPREPRALLQKMADIVDACRRRHWVRTETDGPWHYLNLYPEDN